MSSSVTKVQQRTLSHLRQLLRHARLNFEVASASSSGEPVQDVSLFTNFIMEQYRNNRSIADRSQLKNLRNHAADVVSYLQAVKAQQDLLALMRGVDPDKPMQRRAVARFVGLELPKDTVPLDAKDTTAFLEDYGTKLREKTVDISKLSGIDNLKAQYYGIDAILPNPINKQQNSEKGDAKS